MNHIILDAHKRDTIGSFLGPLTQPYAYKPELRKLLDDLVESAKRSDNRHFVLEGTITRAAQSTLKGAMHYMADNLVLVSIKGCGQTTHVDGTNGCTCDKPQLRCPVHDAIFTEEEL